MTYHELLIASGWIKSLTGCRSCNGRKSVLKYTNPSRPNETVEIDTLRSLFRFRIGMNAVSGGTLSSLQHQHFIINQNNTN